MLTNSDMDKYFRGEHLYGDDFDLSSIEQWYRDEEEAYYELAQNISEYEYYAFNHYYGYSKIADRYFKTCLAIGCANGDDVKGVAEHVDSFIALEPAQKWWSESIGGKPATFIKPSASGEISLENRSVDLVICLGVLHHIPNVSYVISEISRVLQPDGILILREPIFSMGDWRFKREGLTKRERGIPPKLLARALEKAGLAIQHSYPCMVPTTPRIARVFGINNAFNSRFMVVFDRVSAFLLRWNMRYQRKNILQKLAPTSLFIIAKKV